MRFVQLLNEVVKRIYKEMEEKMNKPRQIPPIYLVLASCEIQLEHWKVLMHEQDVIQ